MPNDDFKMDKHPVKGGKSGVAANVLEVFPGGGNWYPRPELNGDPRFRKPLLYPFELREHTSDSNYPGFPPRMQT